MRNLKYVIVLAVAVVLVIGALTSRADDQKAEKPKPYPLDTCLVCGMKLGDMGKPCVFVYKGQEIKVCNESEKKDFEKAPDKYMKKLADAEAKLKK
jgi:YHS domain-containing protein